MFYMLHKIEISFNLLYKMTEGILNIGHRLQLFIDSQGLSNNKFGDKVGVSGSMVSHMVNGNNFGVDKLMKILSSFPQLNIEWLLTGKGEMLHSAPLVEKTIQKEKVVGTGELDSTHQLLVELENKYLKEQLSFKENELASLKSHYKALQEILENFKKV